MSRITKQQKEENYQKLNSVILDIFLSEGWGKVTYDRISKVTGLRKSTLQGYYPSNSDFLVALKGNLKGIMLSELDFGSKRNLLSSWETALNKKEFNFVIEMFISHCVSSEPTPIAHQAMESFHQAIAKALPNENTADIMVQLFGHAVIAPMRDTMSDKRPIYQPS
ncbi:hypothetical protein [Vibrio lentus]|uniref:HTH tetR-type domain-containing protein n=1 Tax=Vibrio lentus TaxID=136468 RepID=A0AA45A8A7_9VIBR|nr:hypothetical protein [Vibrio lentus]MCB5358440.1 hypothetical protein [Vibrio lentus]MCB5448908.1 hypothetical protein [Vibrio lentus]MCB5460795.1 hypothetical protein [Vibrio lentus]MCC4795170.1 hypothetical protein [Vibrio lentus]MCC4853319.1 hypothetical protein [Vibrio lentus]